MLLFGYNTGVYYFESSEKYYVFKVNEKKMDVSSIFVSLIIVLNKVNDIYNIYDLGKHTQVRKKIIKMYKSFGVKELNYEPAIFDSGFPKIVYVRQNYSGLFSISFRNEKNLKKYEFNLDKFYGK